MKDLIARLREEANAIERMHGETLTVEWRAQEAQRLRDCAKQIEALKADRDKLLVMASRMADAINRCQDDDDCSDLSAAYDFRQEYPR